MGSSLWLSIWSNDKPNPDGSQNIPMRNLRLGVYGALGLSFGKNLMALSTKSESTHRM